jgi:hypothetical protein
MALFLPSPCIPKENPVSDKILQALSAPFDPADIHWKPQAISGNRCLAVPYLDARAVMERLDAVFGLTWSDAYELLPGGSVVCRLQVVVDGQAVVKCDVGSPSEQPDDGDKMKAAFSDALKRAAVKFGIGRYLYRLAKQWIDYDAKSKQIMAVPQLPAWALPGKAAADATAAVVSQDQAKELQRLLEDNRRIDPAKFLVTLGVKRLSEVAAARFPGAVTTLSNPPAAILRDAAFIRGS